MLGTETLFMTAERMLVTGYSRTGGGRENIPRIGEAKQGYRRAVMREYFIRGTINMACSPNGDYQKFVMNCS
jgi:hypothetical protein